MSFLVRVDFPTSLLPVLRKWRHANQMPWQYDISSRKLLSHCSYSSVKCSSHDEFVKIVRIYKNLNGHACIPTTFCIPCHSKWPEELHGKCFGSQVNNVRTLYKKKTLSNDLKLELDALGFVWNIREYIWTRKIFPALMTFKQKYQHLSVPHNFVVPSSSDWAKESHNIRLGEVVDGMRSQENYISKYPNRRKQLDELGFVWDHYDEKFSEAIYPALVVFKEQYEHLFVPRHFVVPCADPWPKSSYNLRLGAVVSDIRSVCRNRIKKKERKEQLDQLGFIWNHFDEKFNQIIVPALEHYKLRYGHLQVPWNYIIPCDSTWPKALHNVRLGVIVRDIKCKSSYIKTNEKRRQTLEQIGFFENK